MVCLDLLFSSYELLGRREREAPDGGRPADETGGGVSAEERHRRAADGDLGPLRAGHGRQLCDTMTAGLSADREGKSKINTMNF